MINYELKRFSSKKDDTLGIFFRADDVYSFRCFTLEDEYRTKKEYGETRIPSGVYRLLLRTVGGFHNRYKNKFGESFHKGMIEIVGVPNFTDVLIHIGNDDDDTAGCILVGDSCQSNTDKKGFIGHSTDAYKRLYPEIRDSILSGEAVYLKITNLDTI